MYYVVVTLKSALPAGTIPVSVPDKPILACSTASSLVVHCTVPFTFLKKQMWQFFQIVFINRPVLGVEFPFPCWEEDFDLDLDFSFFNYSSLSGSYINLICYQHQF